MTTSRRLAPLPLLASLLRAPRRLTSSRFSPSGKSLPSSPLVLTSSRRIAPLPLLLIALLALGGVLLYSTPAAAQVVAPTVSSIALTSNSGSDGIYALGDVIQATVTFSAAVDITGSPRLELDFDGVVTNPDRSPRSATCANGTNTTTMVCSYTVAVGDLAPSGTAPYGIAIEANKLTGGTITATGTTTAAVLTHSAVAGVFGHKVDGIRPTLLMTGHDAPGTFVEGKRIHLSFSEVISQGISPVDHDKITIMSGTADVPTISARANGGTVEVTLMDQLTHSTPDITVTLAAGAVEDLAGNGILAVGPIGVRNTIPIPSCAMQRVGGYLLGEHLTSANGKIKATWTLPTDCTFEFEIKVEWWLLFDVEAGTDGGNNIWNGAWDEYRTATCEESPIVTSCTMGSDLHAGQRYAVRVYTIETSTGDARSVSNEVWTVEGASASPVTGLTATADNSSCTVVDGRESTPVELTWDAVPGVSSYQIWTEGGQHDFTDAHSSARVAATSVSGTSHTDSGVKVTGSKYLYVVPAHKGRQPRPERRLGHRRGLHTRPRTSPGTSTSTTTSQATRISRSTGGHPRKPTDAP